MSNLLQFQAKICWTVAGVLIHDNKVLLVKHKKLGIWLNPGGHIEEGELPHVATEREFWEETGVKVHAVSLIAAPDPDGSQFLPTPFLTNIHWVSPENYEERVNGKKMAKTPYSSRGCEQHLNFMFLVKPVGDVTFIKNEEECDDICWFTEKEVAKLDTKADVQFEIKTAFHLCKNLK